MLIKPPSFFKDLSVEQQHVVIALALCGVMSLAWYVIPIAPVPIGLAIVPVGILLMFRQTFLMCLLFILFSFFRLHEAIPVLKPFQLPQLLALASLGGLVWHWVTGGMQIYMTKEMKLLLWFALMVLISVIMSTQRGVSMAYFNGVYIKIIIMTLTVAWLIEDVASLKVAIAGILISGAIVAGIAIFNRLNGIGLIEGTRVTIGRGTGSLLGDPNDLATVLLFPLSFAIALALTRHTPVVLKILGAILVVMICWGILATQSRGGLLGVVAVMGVFGWQRIKNRVLLIVGGTLAAMALYVASGTGDRAVVQGGGDGKMDSSAEGRLHAWEAAIDMAIAHPLTGVGLDMYYGNYFFYTPKWDGKNHAVHSSWFGVLAEIGFIGLALFIAINVFIVRRAWNLDDAIKERWDVIPTLRVLSQALFAGFGGTVVAGSFLTHAFLWPMYILLAMTIAVSRIVERRYPEIYQTGDPKPPSPKQRAGVTDRTKV